MCIGSYLGNLRPAGSSTTKSQDSTSSAATDKRANDNQNNSTLFPNNAVNQDGSTSTIKKTSPTPSYDNLGWGNKLCYFLDNNLLKTDDLR